MDNKNLQYALLTAKEKIEDLHTRIFNLIVNFQCCSDYNIGLTSEVYNNFMMDNSPIYFTKEADLSGTVEADTYSLCAGNEILISNHIGTPNNQN